MCGRLARKSDPRTLAKEFGVAEVPSIEASYNIAPTHEILAVRQNDDGREMTLFKWGLVPSWAKDTSMGARLINARAETVAEKPSFREAYKKRRCLIPAEGFYEWQRREGKKQPHFFRMRDERPSASRGCGIAKPLRENRKTPFRQRSHTRRPAPLPVFDLHRHDGRPGHERHPVGE